MAPAATPTTPPAAAECRWSRSQLAALVAITVLAAALRRAGIEQWSLLDHEVATWRALTAPMTELWSSSEALAPLAWLGMRALGGVGLLPGFAEGWLRLPFAVAGIVAVPLLALLVRQRSGGAPALLAALLLALHPLHVATSQTADPVGLALTCGLAGMAAAAGGGRRAAWIAFAAAGLCAPIGWIFLAVALLQSQAARVVPVASALALVLLPCTLGDLGLPLLVGAALGWLTMATAAPRFPVTLLVGVASLVALLWPACHPVSLVVALPELAAAAALGFVRLGAAARAHLPGSPRVVACGGAAAVLVVVVWLAVDTFLYATVYRGRRPPWRLAADAVLAASNDAPGCVVGAGAGASVLTCYLRPRHWRGDAEDPHPGRTVKALAAAGAPVELAALAVPAGVRVLLVLRRDEQHALPQAARETLRRDFELLKVIESPQPRGDDTLYVHRRHAAR